MVSRQDIDNTSAQITVTIPREELKTKLDAELKRLRQRAVIKGFRQGQVPMDYIKKLYGQSILSDLLSETFSKELYDYVRESGLDVVGQPLLAENQDRLSTRIEPLEPEYKMKYDIGFIPPFEPAGLTPEKVFDRLSVESAEMDRLAEEELNRMRRKGGQHVEIDTDIQEGDSITFNARELENDEIKPDGLQSNIEVLVEYIDDEELKARLLQSKKGDTVRINIRRLEKDRDDEYIRNYFLNLSTEDDREFNDWFEAEIESVSRVQEAELDETFYSAFFNGEIDSREGALEKLKSDMEKYFQTNSDNLLTSSIQKYLLEQNGIELPDAFLKRWLAETNKDTLTDEDIENEYPTFARNLRWSLLRDKLLARYEIDVMEEEISAYYVERLRGYLGANFSHELLGSLVEMLKEKEKEEDYEKIIQEIKAKKLFSALHNEFTINDKPVSYDAYIAAFQSTNTLPY